MSRGHTPKCRNCYIVSSHKYMIHISNNYHICLTCWENATKQQKQFWGQFRNKKKPQIQKKPPQWKRNLYLKDAKR